MAIVRFGRRHLWAETYEGDLRDTLSLQDQVARAFAAAVRTTLTPQEQAGLSSARPVVPAAHQATNELATSYRKLDIRLLAREGALAAGCECSVRWNRGEGSQAHLRIHAYEGELHFRYGVNTQNGCSDAGARIKVTWTPCNYGGTRPWFLCPRGGCGRRVAILYGGIDFGCRTCRRLTYPTQRVHPTSRSLERAQRLRVRLGGSVDLMQPFPPRPKGMHYLTYMKYAMRAWRAEERANAETCNWVNALLGVRQ